MDPDPIRQFSAWFEAAKAASPGEWFEANAMTLATTTSKGTVSARIVLLKEVDDRGFQFFTNYRSKKGQQLAENPVAALVFHWPFLYRQIRIEGVVERLPAAVSDAYFTSRPLGSRIGSHASIQSQVIASRSALLNTYKKLGAEYEGREIPRPAYWGGFLLKPSYFEFWQAGEFRLHDRICYGHGKSGGWNIFRLSP
jgi:pyridoxamine 5'-phosphate oxidase